MAISVSISISLRSVIFVMASRKFLCRVTCLGKKFLVEADNRDTFLTQGQIKNVFCCNYDLLGVVIFNSFVVRSIAVNLLQVQTAMCD